MEQKSNKVQCKKRMIFVHCNNLVLYSILCDTNRWPPFRIMKKPNKPVSNTV